MLALVGGEETEEEILLNPGDHGLDMEEDTESWVAKKRD